jgi:RimJ/RimL family protein N-acetyltransferase
MKSLAIGEQVYLRDRQAADVDRFVYWQTHGEWLQYDAPWAPQQEQKMRAHFMKLTHGDLPVPRTGAMIALKNGHQLIGTVNRYGNDRFPGVYYIGISICEDAYLNRGLGTEALGLWIDYLFGISTVHKIECHTWSLNPRMVHVAEKLGFTFEGLERELVQWQGVWQDRLRYGMLREEWKKR